MARPKLPVTSLLVTDTITCRFCKEAKTVDNFYQKRQNPSGYLTLCKACHSKQETKRLRLILEAHPELREERNRKFRERYRNDPEYRQQFLASSKRNRRKHHLKIHFGLTPDDVRNIQQRQGNKCAICCDILLLLHVLTIIIPAENYVVYYVQIVTWV